MIMMPSVERPLTLRELPLRAPAPLVAEVHVSLLLGNDHTEMIIYRLSINTMMDPSMAGWANSGNKPRIVWPTVTHPANVMRLQVWLTVGAEEWSCVPAALTDSGGPGKDVAANRLAALVDAPASAFSRLIVAGVCSSHGRSSENIQIEPNLILICVGLRRLSFGERLDGHQVENDPAPHVPETVRRRFPGGVHANEFAEEAKQPGSILLLEKEQVFTVRDVISDRFVAASERHLAFLAFTEVAEYLAIVGPSVVIAVLKATFTGDGKNDGVFGRRDDAALALTAIGLMELTPAVVATATDEVPKGHQALSRVELLNNISSPFARHQLSPHVAAPGEVIAVIGR